MESPDSLEFIDAVFEQLKLKAPTADIVILPGEGHADDMLALQPGANTLIAKRIASELLEK